MPDPTRIRAQASGDRVTVRVLMAHEMESGQRRDSAGKPIPAWFIQQLEVAHNGKVVLAADFGPAVSKNPYLQFVFRGGKAGDRITVSWADNRGERRSDDATVT